MSEPTDPPEVPSSVYVDARTAFLGYGLHAAVEGVWHSRDAEVADLTKARNDAEWRQKRCHHHHVESDVDLEAARAEVRTEYDTKVRQVGELLAIVADLRRQLDERRLQTPDEWIAELMPGLKVIDADGWRDKQLWTTRISRAEFQTRIAQCTVDPRGGGS